MNYKRHEAFRFEFKEPIEAEIKLVKLQDKEIDTHTGIVHIQDISPEGMKITSRLDIPLEPKFTLEVHVSLIQDQNLTFLAEIAWKRFGTGVHIYGLHMLNSEEEQLQIINGLKQYAKMHQSHNS